VIFTLPLDEPPRPPEPPRPVPTEPSGETTGLTLVGAVTPSAMAKLVASIVDSNGGAPMGPDEDTGPYGPPPPPRRNRRLGRLVTIGLVGLVVSGLIGAGFTVLPRLSAAGAEQPSAGPPATGAPLPSNQAADPVTTAPTTSAPARPSPTASRPTPTASPTYIIDPTIAAQDVRVERMLSGALVRWRDTSGGFARFFVSGSSETPTRTDRRWSTLAGPRSR
jgi:hypothetical protein